MKPILILSAFLILAASNAALAQEGHAPIELGPSDGDLQHQRSATVSCLQEAESNYKRAWADACPGHFNFPCKTLPALVANPITESYNQERNFCFQAGSGGAGILK